MLAAAMRRYGNRTRDYWEVTNEPNLAMNGDGYIDYYNFAKIVADTVKADPVTRHLALVGPALAFGGALSVPWLENIMNSGIVELFDFITVHFYRPGVPESVNDLDESSHSVAFVRTLIAQHGGQTKPVCDVLSGEWGYSTVDVDETIQASYLVRQWLTMLSAKVQLANWYDWVDDCDDATNKECRFGVVRSNFSPKPAYRAAQSLLHLFGQATLDAPDWPSTGGRALSFDNSSRFVIWNVDTNYSNTFGQPVTIQVPTQHPRACYSVMPLIKSNTTTPLPHVPNLVANQSCADKSGWLTYAVTGEPVAMILDSNLPEPGGKRVVPVK
ncbi:uncharacterized protein MONBRDRAFT_26697 [Monosiga brevicollis MX1]|uniref:Asl1-like glycosyl hydrolase catalytic domain-containing protein n=1 Tax=Monosiga brevicollis TaxID=81824 RepID=A9V337_MONBE|nr:uncharacterized protein MONBRDRAFT_26697 [Monosiga brevicollis MX1]EDQ88120.1 predicted protein [Monosiga brevicollis MX1]|eukprot:XP_001747196.1 hypothetical protein [Monosiga brevicollis MX1]